MPRSGALLTTPGESFPRLRLAFEFCSRCALIRRRLLSPSELRDYTVVNRATGFRQPEYITQIAEALRARGLGDSDLIIEVGANDGTFLDVLRQQGFSRRLAVEPSHECAALCAAKDHRVVNAYLDHSSATHIRQGYGAAGAVICRHTLEHAPEPLELLSAMKLLLRKGGFLFIEVPDARTITHALRVHELWEEHLHYFTMDNMPLLLGRSGLLVEEAVRTPYRGTVNLLIWCRELESMAAPLPFSTDHHEDTSACRHLRARWTELDKRILSRVGDWPKPVAFIGISHPQSNFLLFSGLGSHVDFLVDDDPSKIGRYAPIPQPVPILSTEQLIDEHPPGTIVRGAFGYTEWMDRIEQALAPRNVLVVEPYPYTENEET